MEYLMMGLAIFGGGLIALCLLLLFNSILLYIAAAWVSIAQRTFGKAFLSTLLSFILTMLASFVLAFLPIVGWIVSFAAAFLIPILMTQMIFSTTFGKAFFAEFIRFCFNMFIMAAIAVLVFFLVGFETIQTYFTELFNELGFESIQTNIRLLLNILLFS